jgi:hypothetical protein
VSREALPKLAHSLLAIDSEVRLQGCTLVKVIVDAGFERAQTPATAPATLEMDLDAIRFQTREFTVKEGEQS